MDSVFVAHPMRDWFRHDTAVREMNTMVNQEANFHHGCLDRWICPHDDYAMSFMFAAAAAAIGFEESFLDGLAIHTRARMPDILSCTPQSDFIEPDSARMIFLAS